MKISGRGVSMCVLFVVIGAIVGGLVGELLKSIDAFAGLVPYLTAESEIFTLHPFDIDLFVVRLTLGISFTPHLLSAFGMVLGVVAFKRF